MIAGAGAGLVSSIATCPLDVVKTTLQAQSIRKDQKGYEGVTKTCMRIYRLSGLRGFYRGLGPTIAGYLPTWGIYFTVYDFIKDRMARGLAASGRPDKYPSLIHVTAAMTAGATGTILTNPLWVVKTRFMAQAVLPPDAARYRTTWDAIKTIYRTEGLGAFYKGLLPSLFGVTHVAVQFGLYEKTKAAMTNDGQPLTPTSILVASAFSKMIASLATYPHEVLRTRMQPPGPATLYSPLVTGSTPPVVHSMGDATDGQHSVLRNRARWSPKKGGIVDTFRKIYRQDGWQGFYRGLSINLVRTVPSSAVTMLTYELIMRNLS
ncbi:Mitochondrial substrate carrier family protein W [Vanrija pseudolonga]|uniref:Mitochondrial substrate carrier family protein W n=1 Tax=Vanrija pseudolonga TaxID=143232 RepID=A0AAF0YC05_9TREE|nr:Mitochondrial substrate carrier family protein W [Vanrija pseudolonga]